MLPLSFGAPLVLAGLAALPVIWWLLRLTPPKPREELFPPLRILAKVLKREETPHRSPWWLTLLRLAMAALVILALSEPIFNPRERLPAGGAALALVVDNSWASASDWELRVATAERLIADAEAENVPVVLAFTADAANAEIGPFDGTAARERLNAASPRPLPARRAEMYGRVAAALADLPGAAVAVLSDGLAQPGDVQAFDALLGAGAARLVWIAPERLPMVALTGTANGVDALSVTAVRAPGDPAPRRVSVGAFDERGRRIADAAVSFAAGETEATDEFRLPFELRNDFASLSVDGESQAAAVRMLDENSRRRRVGLISAAEADRAQPLLSPLYYIRRAMEPYADLVEAGSADLSEAVPALLEQKPAMIVMADIGILPEEAHRALAEWVEGGGTLVRFAGSRLAAAEADDDLLPVTLRMGERSMGGALSWTEPQAVSDFPATGPFADLTPPNEVTVSRQVLAQPTPDIVERTWATLADGTPLVTGARRDQGTLVLFHVTPEATWSNLPISGSFVEMLRRLVQISRNSGRLDQAAGGGRAALPPYRMIAADARIVPPPPEARPLDLSAGTEPAVTLENPPGLYGGEEGVLAHNLLSPGAALAPVERPQTALPVSEAAYAADEQKALRGPLFAAALVLMVLDMLAVLWMGGALARRAGARRTASAASATAGALAALALTLGMTGGADAQDTRPDDQAAIDAISVTRIAYVVTGMSSVDSISRAGLTGLSRFLADKTALEPGDPVGVDIAQDELAFFPLIYWPIDAGAPMPSPAAIARIDAYMQQGGSVLFDTRDQFSQGLDDASAATQRLREILSTLNVPPLEPVPPDHVLTKSFFIMNEFPGRYSGSPLWVESSLDATNGDNRPVRTGDGVTPILITGNDLAGAWAVDSAGNPMLPTVPNDPMQRMWAMRGGINIMMYMLTGNYKSDQVHVPVLLERLGQ